MSAGDGLEAASKPPNFEFEDAVEVRRPVDVPSPQGAPPQHPPTPPAQTASRSRSDSACDAPKGTLADHARSLLDERRRKRLLFYAPTMLLLYLLVGWFFVGEGLGWFALAGLGVGVFAAWRKRGETLLGSVAAVMGLAASLVAVQSLLVFVIVSTGVIGYVAGIDDRLRNG
jgi:hypothetical protein